MTIGEKRCMDEIITPHGKWWAPCIWFATLITQLRREGRIKDDILFKTILDELHLFRDGLGKLYSYDWICVPLVYTQVTTLAVYTYFLGSVIGQQFLDPDMSYPGHSVDLYVPVFTLLQFFFYMGWLKVAEQLINPFGEDEDDFDMNWIIDRNFQVSLLVVDDMYGRLPPMERDIFWDEEPPTNLPYTKSSLSSFIAKPFMGSTADLSINGSNAKFVDPMETIPEIQISPDCMTQSKQSIMSSPAHTRRIHSNLLNSLKSQLIGSKSTLDNLKVYPEDVTAEPTPMSSPVHGRRSLHKNLLSRLSSQLDSSKGNLKQGADTKYPGSVVQSRSNIPRVHSCIEDLMENNGSYYSHDDARLYAEDKQSGLGKASISNEFLNRVRVNSFTRRRVDETIKAAKSQKRDTQITLTQTPAPQPPSVGSTTDATQENKVNLGHEHSESPADIPTAVLVEESSPSCSAASTPNEAAANPVVTVPEVRYHNGGDGYLYEVPSSDQSTVNSLTPLLQSCQTSSEEDIAEELVAVVTVL